MNLLTVTFRTDQHTRII